MKEAQSKTEDPVAALKQAAKECANELKVLERIARKRPLHPHELVRQGRCLQLDDENTCTLEDAEISYRAALGLDPAYVPAWLELGWFIHRTRDDPASAIGVFEWVAKICKEWKEEIDVLTAELNPSDVANGAGTDLEPVNAAIRRRYIRPADSMLTLEEVIGSRDAEHDSASCFESLPKRSFDEKLDHLNEMARHRELHPHEMAAKGRYLLLAGQVPEFYMRAETCYQAALGRDADYLPAYIELGWLSHIVRRDPATASNYFHQALQRVDDWYQEAEKGKSECQEELLDGADGIGA